MTAPALAAVGIIAWATAALAQEDTRPSILREIGFDQHLGASLPLDLAFRDEGGRTIRLGEYFGGKPVVLSLNYYGCTMLCTVTLNGLAAALNVITLDAGKEFQIITVSFDHTETPEMAAAKKKTFLTRYQRPTAAAGWHFLTGDAPAIDALTNAVGFRYAWDAETRQFAHPSGVVVVTPEGRIARYMYGIEYAPRDLRLALVEASAGRIGSSVDQLLLYCYRYDPVTGKYGALIMRIVRLGGILTVLSMGAFILIMRRKEKAAARAH